MDLPEELVAHQAERDRTRRNAEPVAVETGREAEVVIDALIHPQQARGVIAGIGVAAAELGGDARVRRGCDRNAQPVLTVVDAIAAADRLVTATDRRVVIGIAPATDQTPVIAQADGGGQTEAFGANVVRVVQKIPAGHHFRSSTDSGAAAQIGDIHAGLQCFCGIDMRPSTVGLGGLAQRNGLGELR